MTGGRVWVEQLESRQLLSGDAVAAAAASVVQTGFGKYQPLDRLYQEYLAQGTSAGLAEANPLLQVLGDRVAVELLAADFNTNLQGQLESLGMQITGRSGTRISGWVPIAALSELSSLSGVRATPSYKPMTNVGSVTSQGDAVMRSDDVRRYLGYDGTGVTVGVLSDSFNCRGGYAADIASGDLPAGIRVIADAPTGTDEGRAMLQLIHDVAPGATLMFATAWGGELDFADNIRALANAGADIIVDDVQYFSEPMFMDGAVAKAVDEVVARGVAYFSSAGNQARLSYEALGGSLGGSLSGFRPSGQYVTLSDEFREELHNFAGSGVDPYQQITVPVGTGVIVSFQWAEPFRSLVPQTGGVKSDLDIILYSNDVSQGPITGSALFSLGDDPIEVFEFVNDGSYDSNQDGVPDTTFQLAIGQWNTTGTPAMKYVMYQIGDRSKGTVTIDEYATNSGTC
ncbi:MAG: S8 family peptidase, partial [Bacillota bacterium]